MAGRWDHFQGMPQGWEVKYDQRIGRYYFIDHVNHKTSWEDPRLKHAPPPPTHAETQGQENQHPQDNRGRDSHASNVSSSSNAYLQQHPLQDITDRIEQEELALAKISAMFPTVPEQHIKDLMKKYLKGIFPKVEPTVLLDTLTSCDFSIKEASEKLIAMGFDKKDTSLVPPKLKEDDQRKAEDERLKLVLAARASPGPPRPKNLTEKHKKKVRNQLTLEFPALTPTVVTMALQSVLYEEERGRQVLTTMVENDKTAHETLARPTPKMDRRNEPKSVSVNISPPPSRREIKTTRPLLTRQRSNTPWTTQSTSHGTNTDSSKGEDRFRSDSRCAPRGPDQALHKGPSETLLLTDYQSWHGPNPDNSLGQSGMARGPDNTLRRGPSGITVRGPDPSLRRGPAGLAKGSQFTKSIRKEPSFSTKNL